MRRVWPIRRPAVKAVYPAAAIVTECRSLKRRLTYPWVGALARPLVAAHHWQRVASATRHLPRPCKLRHVGVVGWHIGCRVRSPAQGPGAGVVWADLRKVCLISGGGGAHPTIISAGSREGGTAHHWVGSTPFFSGEPSSVRIAAQVPFTLRSDGCYYKGE